MAKRMFTGTKGNRQPTKAESAAASEAAFGPPKAPRPIRPAAKPRPAVTTPMGRQVSKLERQTAMY